MKFNSLFYIALFCILLFSTDLLSQSPDAPHAITLKWVGTDYLAPNLDAVDYDLDLLKFGVEAGYTRYLANMINLSIPLRIGSLDLPEAIGNASNDSEFFASLDAVLQFTPLQHQAAFKPYALAGISGIYNDVDDFYAAVPLGLGLGIKIARGAYAQVQAEYRIGLKDDRDHVQLTAGLYIPLGLDDRKIVIPVKEEEPVLPIAVDTDGDGIDDLLDECPQEAGKTELNGCPDFDNDGIADKLDDCPDLPGLRSFNGCPDSDGDGIIDVEDDCPNQIGTRANNGCPLNDSDDDGVVDAEDECPDVPGLVRFKGCADTDADGVPDQNDECPETVGPAELNGCPDSDGDGVLDKIDKCPGKPGPSSNMGCPEIKEEVRRTLEYAAQNVEFHTNSARVRSRSRTILNDIAEIMKQNPDYNLSIEGHTDNTGSDRTNQRLSEKRAEACRDYLISRGISSIRLSAAGYGESQPIADNDSSSGRKRNRRVEFNLYLP